MKNIFRLSYVVWNFYASKPHIDYNLRHVKAGGWSGYYASPITMYILSHTRGDLIKPVCDYSEITDSDDVCAWPAVWRSTRVDVTGSTTTSFCAISRQTASTRRRSTKNSDCSKYRRPTRKHSSCLTDRAQQTSPSPYCRVLPPGEFNGMISERLPDDSESFKTVFLLH